MVSTMSGPLLETTQDGTQTKVTHPIPESNQGRRVGRQGLYRARHGDESTWNFNFLNLWDGL